MMNTVFGFFFNLPTKLFYLSLKVKLDLLTLLFIIAFRRLKSRLLNVCRALTGLIFL
jgi:hypothetical protein